MKLLLGQAETVEENGIKVSLKVVTTAIQAKLSDLSTDATIEGRIKLIGYVLRNIVESIEIDGKQYDPEVVATRADLSDKDTMAQVFTIGAMAMSKAFASEDDVKK